MDSFWHDPSGEHDIRLHYPSHIIHQVVVVRIPPGGRERESEQEDEHTRHEDAHKGLELVPPNLLEP